MRRAGGFRLAHEADLLDRSARGRGCLDRSFRMLCRNARMLDSGTSMDALSEILRVIKLDSAIYLNGEFREPWCVSSPEALALAPALSGGAGHVIIYHLLHEGRAY